MLMHHMRATRLLHPSTSPQARIPVACDPHTNHLLRQFYILSLRRISDDGGRGTSRHTRQDDEGARIVLRHDQDTTLRINGQSRDLGLVRVGLHSRGIHHLMGVCGSVLRGGGARVVLVSRTFFLRGMESNHTCVGARHRTCSHTHSTYLKNILLAFVSVLVPWIASLRSARVRAARKWVRMRERCALVRAQERRSECLYR